MRLSMWLAAPFILFNTVSATLYGRDPCQALESTPLEDIPVPPFAQFDPDLAQIMRYQRQRSVNLGSWFVNERWMSPSMFPLSGVSELDVASGWKSPSCSRLLLENHWARWINESDFEYLQQIGINTVRIPIGYWTVPGYCQGTPFAPVAAVYRNSWSYLVRGINYAAKYNIGVLIDLHGAPGSQNGQPHSGISNGRVDLFNSPWNVNQTISVLTFLMQQLCLVTNVVGIELLNEPQDGPQLIDFYEKAIDAMRAVSPEAQTFPLYVHDGFNLEKFRDFVASRTDFVVQDHHSYYVFAAPDSLNSASNLTEQLSQTVEPALAHANMRGNLVIDEWSCALTPQSLAYEKDQEAARRAFCTTQLAVYSTAASGWSFWSYKMEQYDVAWSFLSAVGRALPSDFFWYKSACGSQRNDGVLRRSNNNFKHRFAAIHSARLKRETLTPQQQSQATGYSDGLETARKFCAQKAQLGFTEQYIMDRIKELGSKVVAGGTEADYREGFYQGLSDAEAEE